MIVLWPGAELAAKPGLFSPQVTFFLVPLAQTDVGTGKPPGKVKFYSTWCLVEGEGWGKGESWSLDPRKPHHDRRQVFCPPPARSILYGMRPQ
jgi:hypothetical protein